MSRWEFSGSYDSEVDPERVGSVVSVEDVFEKGMSAHFIRKDRLALFVIFKRARACICSYASPWTHKLVNTVIGLLRALRIRLPLARSGRGFRVRRYR